MNAKERIKQDRIKLCQQVIDYLNERADRRFQSDTRGTRKLFTAEWSHKYGLPQYKGVIDYLVSKWSGDPRMEPYLRPATLFGPEKFPEYLAEARALIAQTIRKNRLIPISKYLPVEKADFNTLTSFDKYDPNG